MATSKIVRYIGEATYDPWIYVAELDDGCAYSIDARNGRAYCRGKAAQFEEQMIAGMWRFKAVPAGYSPRSR